MLFISQGKPARWTISIALVFCNFFSISFGSILKVIGSISANIGFAPDNIIEFIVDTKSLEL